MNTLKSMNSVGQPLKRKDAAAKVQGKAVYTGDIRMPGMLYGKALRSEFPHAKISNIDISNAKNIKGVHADRKSVV